MLASEGISIPEATNNVTITNYYNIQKRTKVYVFYNISYETLDGTKLEQGWVQVSVSAS